MENNSLLWRPEPALKFKKNRSPGLHINNNTNLNNIVVYIASVEVSFVDETIGLSIDGERLAVLVRIGEQFAARVRVQILGFQKI